MESEKENEPFKDIEWKSLRIAFKGILLITLIVLSMVLVLTIFGVSQSTTTIEYSVSENYIVDDSLLTTNTTENFINDTVETRYFNASYSFYGEVGETGTDISWVDTDTNTISEVDAILGNHLEVIDIDDNNAGVGYSVINEFTAQTDTTIEFWINSEAGATYQPQIRLYDSGAVAIQSRIDKTSGTFQIHNSVDWQTLTDWVDETWFHYRLDFDCTTDKVDVYINGLDCGNWDFTAPSTNIDQIRIYTPSTTTGHVYLDAIGYDWLANYTIDDNIFPYSYEITNETIDKWHFFHNEDGSITEAGQQDIPYFTEVGTLAYIVKNQEDSDDETAVYFPIASTTDEGIYRDIDIESYNTATLLTKTIRGGNGASQTLYEYYDVYSYDDTLIVRLRIDDTVSSGDLILYYYNGATYTQLADISDTFYNYIFNITLIHGYVYFTLNDTTYTFSSLDASKDGIGSFRIWADLAGASPAQTGLFIDYVGVYINSSSIANDFGAYLYPTNEDYRATTYNYLELNATGSLGLGFNSYEIAGLSVALINFTDVSNTSFDNVYDLGSNLVENAYLVISTNQSNSFTINSISVYGIKVSDGTNDYIPTYVYSNVDMDVSYFYVAGDRLHYTMYIDDTGTTEYITAEININNVYSVNRSYEFYSYSNSIGTGSSWVNYTDGTVSNYEFPYYLSATSEILPQTKVIRRLHIRISDGNNDGLNSYTATGYIRGIKLKYLPNVDYTITTLNLLEILVPLIVIIVPTLVMYKRFGKSAILPSLIAMSLVCFIGSLIPAWIFFIIAFGLGLLLVFQVRGGGSGGSV